MPIIGISIAETEDYIPEGQKEKTKEKGATFFTIGSLDVDQRAELSDSLNAMELGEVSKITMARNTVSLRALRYALRGWGNFKDDKGKDIPFSTTELYRNGKTYVVPKDETLNRIPPHILREVGEKILEKNSISLNLAGKSEVA